ncbi:Putative pterin-4-alpha-carbinolamine dehydratase [uncultured archaeon]|nr:Putative pterin-4-alpha-carbinolamine dehydratase [uncultured archaeon]
MVRDDIHILSIEEINERLEKLPGWDYKDNKISKEFKFPGFLEVVDFLVKIAPFFEKNDHHPDIKINYSKVLFELTRWDLDGKVTDMDFITAIEIERVFKEISKPEA